MGQQQLILLVLGIVVVGVAIVIGIQAFNENSKKSNMDALLNDAIDLASRAQTWMLKPSIYGGGNNSCRLTCDWSSLTLASMGYAVGSGGQYSSVNGDLTIDGSSSPTQLVVTGSNASTGNQVVVTVTGTTAAAITTAVDSDYSP